MHALHVCYTEKEIVELKLGDYFAVQRALEPKDKHMESSLSQGKSQGKSQAELQAIRRLDYHSATRAHSHDPDHPVHVSPRFSRVLQGAPVRFGGLFRGAAAGGAAHSSQGLRPPS